MPTASPAHCTSQANEVLIKNVSAGVCHTDLHAMEGDINFPTPAVFGHEVSGEVVEVNDPGGNSTLQVGDRVIGTFIMPCGTCRSCNNNLEERF